MTERTAHLFPFSAVVGQETLKTALCLNAIDPRVGGVLIRGEKGTAKSTIVRALAAVLPEMDVVENCRFSCDPSHSGSWCIECRSRELDPVAPIATRRPWIVDLPVSITEDRLVGTLCLEHALKFGERTFEPGILARANRSILYVDEVNLLDDHLVDTLLDVAAMGVNTVEREGISFQHPARFILVGTMNPEEGELRPQLLDRFGLCVDVKSVRDPALRVEILDRRRRFEEDAKTFSADWVADEDELRVRLEHARARLSSVMLSEDVKRMIVSICLKAGVDGHRSDLVMARAACAWAAWNARDQVEVEDLITVAPLVLAHRVPRSPVEQQTSDQSRLKDMVSSALLGGVEQNEIASPPSPTSGNDSTADDLDTTLQTILSSSAEQAGWQGADAPKIDRQLDDMRRSISGRRHQTVSDDHRGKHVRSVKAGCATAVDMALGATVREAAVHQQSRDGGLAVNIDPSDVMKKVRKRKAGASIVLCVDASGSMGATERMEAARGAALGLLVDAYQRRDRVGLVSFRGEGTDIVMAPTASVELAQLKLRNMPAGGATPLAAGLLKSLELLQAEMKRDPQVIPWLVVLTDGRANVGLNGGLGSEDARAVGVKIKAAKLNTIVFDAGSGPKVVSGALEIARITGGEYIRLSTVEGTSMLDAVRSRL
ncbi:MAG: magnesium chelatase subunit D family protein [Actinobacteria bacterium]|nr:magnesium chelatase subunit D family protein [Actinomycetota bacterium]MCL5886949.1 magnesium chelatase subunit D family protein [Actinomycetota bacterium]